MSRPLMFWLAALLVFAGACTIWLGLRRQPAVNAVGSVTVAEEASRLGEDDEKLTSFEFTDQSGKEFSSAQLKGKVWMGSFFFADCPSICVMQNNEIAKVHRRFLDAGLETVSISVTPQKDPPHKLREYGSRFSADHDHWKFLTGKDIDYVRQVGKDIFSLAAADETHTSQVAVFDRGGNLRGAFTVTSPPEQRKMVQLIEELLAEKAPESSPAPAASDASSAPDGVDANASAEETGSETPREYQEPDRRDVEPAAAEESQR